jgi:hypothetical protein
MPHDPEDPWRLVGFLDRLDLWIALESPDDDLRLTVTDWIFTRYTDPYEGVRRESGFANLWFGQVPGSSRDPDSAVFRSYWIQERTHSLRCDSIATLSLPA